ncbi:Lrp/AsnC ligand binding domain-containing protein [Vogesella sp. LYT5W]|uniref:Lrp/AsnC ligand binding domain-containing protein n=1 Tax=Vogesella margarita TaxID=2984199 RepID=A0ABT5IRR7_9NEIS|nr:Lrp/AsnC ligand binding domain-containing protein [Vogesella margarita]MDC7715261.1 Lrp/AsnC ligand binding domain-containing protein [Vogesella margarita]
MLRRTKADLDRRKLELDGLAFVQICFGAHGGNGPNAFEAAMRTQPQVLSCHKITGDADYLMQVVATSLDAYSDFVGTCCARCRAWRPPTPAWRCAR